MKVRYGDNGLVIGRGVSSDVIEASARAYANALSKVKTMIGKMPPRPGLKCRTEIVFGRLIVCKEDFKEGLIWLLLKLA